MITAIAELNVECEECQLNRLHMNTWETLLNIFSYTDVFVREIMGANVIG